MTEVALKSWMAKRNLTILDGSPAERTETLRRVIVHCLPRKSVSDRTCHRNIVGWIRSQLDKETIDSTAFLRRLIDAVIEATNPSVRNANAVFMTILKKELGYPGSGKSKCKM